MGFTRWASAKVFNFVHHNNLVYNTCWEDPRLDREAMALRPEHEVMVITSAGCNALDYVLDSPKHVYAVDMNPRQNALLELKKAGIKRLEYDDFFDIFGKGFCPRLPELYQDVLREELPEFARIIWDKKLNYFTSPKPKNSFYYRGTSGMFAKFLSYHINWHRLQESFCELFDAGSLESQSKIYYNQIHEVFWSKILRAAMKVDAVLALLGVPRAQRELIEKEYVGGIAKFCQDCLEAVCAQLPIQDNYFWWLYLTGSYEKERCPSYLREENFQRLKNENLAERVSTHNSSILEFLRHHPGRISHFVLLDHMDWLASHHHQVLQAQWQEIVRHAAQPSRILWRSGGLRVDFVDPIEVDFGGQQTPLGSVLNYQNNLAERLHQKDRVHTYGSFYIADLQAA